MIQTAVSFGLLLILAFFEVLFVGLPLVFMALFLWQQLKSEDEAFVFAFLVGFLLDILLLRPLGFSSALMLTLLFLPTLYKRKYQVNNVFFLGVTLFLTTVLLTFVASKTLEIGPSIISMLIVIVLLKLFSRGSQRYESGFRFS